jgi:hypothetical protein
MVGLSGFATKKQFLRVSRQVFGEFALWEWMDPSTISDQLDTLKFA